MILFVIRLFVAVMDFMVYSLLSLLSGKTNGTSPMVLSWRLYSRFTFLMFYLDCALLIVYDYFVPGTISSILDWFQNHYTGVVLTLPGSVPKAGHDDVAEAEGSNFLKLLESQKKILNGTIPRAGGRGLIKWFLRVHRIIHAKAPSKSVIKVCKSFSRDVYLLRRDSGPVFLLQYLKGCSVLLQQYVARHRIPDPRAVGPAVSRTRAGLPRIIPRWQRVLIRKSDPKVIQFWLSLFNLYRVLESRHDMNTEKSKFVNYKYVKYNKILGTILFGSGLPADSSFMESSSSFLPVFWRSWLSPHYVLPKNQYTLLPKYGLQSGPFLSNKATATLLASRYLASSYKSVLESVFLWRKLAFETYGRFMMGGLSSETLHSPDHRLVSGFALWTKSVTPWIYNVLRYEVLPLNVGTPQNDFDREWARYNRKNMRGAMAWGWIKGMWTWTGSMFSFVSKSVNTRAKETGLFNDLGRLVALKEAAGKVRVIAIVDILTQWALAPLHELIFDILRTIPQDGTFDQEKPIFVLRDLLREKDDRFAASYDLSAATDCLPLDFQKIVLGWLIGSNWAGAWADILSKRSYTYRKRSVYYGVGQPMGALSSWASLAITHHFIVQWASWLSGNRVGWFKYYAVLGDDVVIADRKVAAQYLVIMQKLGVKIGLAKSLVSDSGVMEFAKKFYSLSHVMTPVPIRELLVAEVSFPVHLNLIRKYRIRLADLLSLMGYRHKVLGSIHNRFALLPKKVRTLLLTYSGPGGPGFSDLKTWMSSTSLVTRSPRELDHQLGLKYLVETCSLLMSTARLAVKQGGFSLSVLEKKHMADIIKAEPFFGTVDIPSMRETAVLAEEDRPMYHYIKQNLFDPQIMEESLKAHHIFEAVEGIMNEVRKRFFFATFDEFLLWFEQLEKLRNDLFLVRLVEVQVRSEPKLKPNARRLVKLFNKLAYFSKTRDSTYPDLPFKGSSAAKLLYRTLAGKLPIVP